MDPLDPGDLPSNLRRDLENLSPSLPPHLSSRERDLLQQAHAALRRRRSWMWKASAAAAALLLALGAWQFTANRPAQVAHLPLPSPQVTLAEQPTIVDALHLAKRLQARAANVQQAEIDRIAFAAVNVSPRSPQ